MTIVPILFRIKYIKINILYYVTLLVHKLLKIYFVKNNVLNIIIYYIKNLICFVKKNVNIELYTMIIMNK